MPLSRLSPRSSRRGLARLRSSARGPAGSQRHLQLWAAIRKTREELDSCQRQIEQVDALFRKHIVPREYELTDAMNTLTGRLILHFAQSDLDIPGLSLLGLWITENLNSLQDHPFGDPERTGRLSDQWQELLDNDGPVESQLVRLARRNGTQASAEGDAAGEFEHRMGSTEQHSENDSSARRSSPESSCERMADTRYRIDGDSPQNNTGKHAPDEHTDSGSDTSTAADRLQSLEDKLSVERLFRQLAKVLHPDREQDDIVRARKHVLMSQCLKARQEKDINALLSLYCEHVGELPDDLNNNSHTELVNALEVQLRQLQAELRQMRFGDPLQSMIIERYASSDNADSERRIQSHAKSLDIEIGQARLLIEQLEDYDGLLDALDERRSVELDRLAINEMTGQG